MTWLKKHPVFVACLALCTAAVVIEAALLAWHVVQAHRGQVRLEQKRRERATFADGMRAPGAPNTVVEEIAATEKSMAGVRREFSRGGRGGHEEVRAPTSLEEFFSIGKFTEEIRGRALRAGILLKPDERFGMASYRNEGPAPESVPTVATQRLVLGELLGMLVDARPRELIAVRRERARKAEAGLDAGGVAADYFLSERTKADTGPQLARVQSFRLEFIGRTSVLRHFLNAIASSRTPLFVRSVEAEPVVRPAKAERPAAGEPVALVTSHDSKFSVAVDYLELVEMPTPGGGDEPAADPPATSLWGKPAAQSRGAAWTYEIFTPPDVFFDETARTYATAPPTKSTPQVHSEELVLAEVRREPYRVQLVGCVGAPADYVAVLSSPGRPETFLARVHERVERLGIAVTRLEMLNLPVSNSAGGLGWEVTATATVHDELAGEDVVLDSRSQRLTDKRSARFTTKDGSPRERAEGESWQEGEVTCRLVRVEWEPPRVLIERTAATGQIEQVWLAPPGTVPSRADQHASAGDAGLNLERNERVVSSEPNR